jgi:anaerobic ribonucleoside-triphosphate reductase
MEWTPEQRELAARYHCPEDVPVKERRYKCHTCQHVVMSTPCPFCGETHLEVMCPLDHCDCSHDVISGIEYCPLCGAAVCPHCGSHDVVQISRVTGYLQDVSGWNAGKQQELKDRVRYPVA